MGTQDNPQVRRWSDSITIGSSNIERLQFEPAYDWTRLEICVENTSNTSAPVTMYIEVDNQRIDTVKLTVKKEKTEYLPVYNIDGRKSINIRGHLSGGVQRRAVSITAKAYWKADTPPLKTESVSASFQTSGMCMIHDIWLPGTRHWDSCEVLIEGGQMKSTLCCFALVQDGALNGGVQKICLNGTDSKTIQYEGINARVPLVIGGTLSNCSVVFGAGAKITLTGFYREDLS